jgi:uncharacterized membrane protein
MTNRPLSKDFYSFIIFFLSILVIISLIQSVALLNIGSRILTLESFYPWAGLVIAVIAIANAALLRYLAAQRLPDSRDRVRSVVRGSFFANMLLILNVQLRVVYQEHYHVVAWL